jgi:hypothetical protein
MSGQARVFRSPIINLFNHSELEEVAGILKYPGKKISIDQMAEAIEKGALEHK